MARKRILILGAGGARFPRLQRRLPRRSGFEVIGITAAQIPNIDHRRILRR